MSVRVESHTGEQSPVILQPQGRDQLADHHSVSVFLGHAGHLLPVLHPAYLWRRPGPHHPAGQGVPMVRVGEVEVAAGDWDVALEEDGGRQVWGRRW